MSKNAKSNFFDTNPRTIALKQFMFQILESKYPNYEDLINRAAFFLVTENDLNMFSKLVGEIYEKGYLRAVEDYREQLSKFGITINLTKKNLVDNP